VAVAIITGSGTHSLPGFADAHAEPVPTPYGEVEVVRGTFGGEPVLHVSRHGAGHARLSNLVPHRADIWALAELGADAVIGCTACGAVDPSLELGSLIVFDDLWYLSNRLPDGSLCTFHDQAGDPRRGHWILHGGPFAESVRTALLAGAAQAGHPARDGGVYGHVDGPRFNTPVEIQLLAAAGVSAVSQTGGPETVLCGELELPFALVGFVTDYANEVIPGATTPIEQLRALMAESTAVFAAVLEATVRGLAAGGRLGSLEPGGTMFRFDRG
jgi:purine nucleoside phosphorylase